MKRVLLAALAALLLTGCALTEMIGGVHMTGGAKATLSFHSFDGGGPEFDILIDEDIVSWERTKAYAKANHAELDGAGYDVTFTFTGVRPGETRLIVQERSPIGDNLDRIYAVKVDEALNVSIEHLTTENLDAFVEPVPTLMIEANGHVFCAALEDNASAAAFAEMLSAGSIEVSMSDYGDFEKVGPLPWTLETCDEEITTVPGDVILYEGNQITIYYDRNNWRFTRLARIDSVTKQELLDAFGDGDATVTFWVEWSE